MESTTQNKLIECKNNNNQKIFCDFRGKNMGFYLNMIGHTFGIHIHNSQILISICNGIIGGIGCGIGGGGIGGKIVPGIVSFNSTRLDFDRCKRTIVRPCRCMIFVSLF
ncbi:hypothetical protein DERP_005951 [Dermatophagoides pteronyssinus]|uniref:Uncharacterized protein n=1 Tax=Dermatophagoides pteronyssinus TaxID=6956 RepID=A0ABQ8JRW3_DERPT|nr:hypothetical protein DERP_005951 [Dermatophagoides pteronyssinus]